jgi:hypothetical protein
VVANDLDPQRAARLRTDLWAAAGGESPEIVVDTPEAAPADVASKVA